MTDKQKRDALWADFAKTTGRDQQVQEIRETLNRTGPTTALRKLAESGFLGSRGRADLADALLDFICEQDLEGEALLWAIRSVIAEAEE